MFPRSKRPLSNARCRSTAAAPKTPAKAAAATQTDGERGDRHAATSRSSETAPARAEDGLARLVAVGGQPAGPERSRELRVACEPADGRSERLGVAGRNEQRALAVGSSSRAAGVSAVTSGVPHASA